MIACSSRCVHHDPWYWLSKQSHVMSIRLLYDDEEVFANYFMACLFSLLGLSCSIDGISALWLRTLDIHILCLSSYLLQQKRICWKLLIKTYRSFVWIKISELLQYRLIAYNCTDRSWPKLSHKAYFIIFIFLITISDAYATLAIIQKAIIATDLYISGR